MKRRIILASTSPIRRQMLEKANINFDVIAPDCDEEKLKKELSQFSILIQALELAKEKAISISKKHPEDYVIGSDQICDLDGEIINKSRNRLTAFESLNKLQGKTHRQNNGTCIFLNGKPVMEHKEFAELTMRELSNDEIEEYITRDNPIGCAGSYKFELTGKALFTKIKGKDEVVKGFSLSEVLKFLGP